MRCVVTMKETNSMFENIPLSVEARKAATELRNSDRRKYRTMRSAIKALRKSFAENMVKELDVDAGALCKEQKNTEAH